MKKLKIYKTQIDLKVNCEAIGKKDAITKIKEIFEENFNIKLTNKNIKIITN